MRWLWAFLLFAVPAFATTLVRADLEELVRRSERVVRAKVVKVEPHWSGDRTHIVTDVTLEVAEDLKGQGAHQVIVRQPGGVVGDVGQQVSGLASWTRGEEVVVCLERHGPLFRVAGMAQGKYRVVRDASGARARPDPLGDTTVLDAHSGQEISAFRPELSLEELRARVKRAGATR
jgi:hypothetical protein